MTGRPSWMDGTIWAKAADADAVGTCMKGSTAGSVVLARQSSLPSSRVRLDRSVGGILAVDALSEDPLVKFWRLEKKTDADAGAVELGVTRQVPSPSISTSHVLVP